MRQDKLRKRKTHDLRLTKFDLLHLREHHRTFNDVERGAQTGDFVVVHATGSVDGKPVGSLSSPGIAHPTKRQLRLAVPRNAVVDDLRIWRVDGTP